MRSNTIYLALLALVAMTGFHNSAYMDNQEEAPIAIVIHGGAGSILPGQLSPEEEQVRKDILTTALDAGYGILQDGGGAVDAVEAAIALLEDSEFFNAGKGAVLTEQGRAELDASIMRGEDLNAGAVASVTTIKNPIKGARAVMEYSKHVLLAREGAEAFADELELERVQNSYFITTKQINRLEKFHEKLREKQDTAQRGMVGTEFDKFGTVGAVALDMNGDLAAGTSTGGMMNKMYGRVGDSPLIGAGTYANNQTCGVSCTGWGEYFIRLAVAHDISALMSYKNLSLKDAAKESLQKVKDLGGSGGVIAIDRHANIVMDFNTNGMYRAYRNSAGESEVLMYK